MGGSNTIGLRVAIVGSGFAGIGMAIRLRRMGVASVTVYEAAAEIGGTWRDNAYPGAACDIPSHLYSFSFAPNPSWTRTFASQQEILAYLNRCARDQGVASLIRCNARVAAARFDDARRIWRLDVVAAQHGRHGDTGGIQTDNAQNGPETVEVDVLIAASGPLSRPALPAIAGLDRFGGALFHSARWDHAYPLEGKTVAVIGTGASAVQFIPRIQPRVARLHVFQRTPPWVMPRPDRAIDPRTQHLFRFAPWAQRLVRWAIYWRHEARALAFIVNPKWMKAPMRFAGSYLERRVKDPALRAKLAPNYLLGCKRVLLSSDYYPALVQPNVDVVTSPIREIVEDGIVTEDGRRYRVDAIICGTGFDVADAGAPFPLYGSRGESLDARWRSEGPQAYLGASIAGFPNFFMMIGPNTGLGHNSMVYMIESHIAYIASCLKLLVRRGARTMEVRADVQAAYNERVQKAFEGTVWMSGCRSWYLSARGKNTALWPGFSFAFRRLTRRVRAGDYRFDESPGTVRPSETDIPALP
ncbi:MAG TPA: NAD(P)/FAD-dependent oxidoreductase [Trinickia sp.]|uniref:flavin-containing monooxygenase n=1 Tax=Trinickia sp. TaxID=2571163 RepID=UPI002C22D4AE|nr:NAD(P)/FAD-dependent oxidoreductase [Trinickia sp.]HVW49235.1 NAD(P)/FAD-dependent oxidoreductase [Trinickia sp.]